VVYIGEPVSVQPAAAPPKAEYGHETVLLVEDEAKLRGLARQSLEGQGYTVIEAGDGIEAMQQAQGHRGPIHLLLTDVIMPGMNGRELAGQLAPRRPEMRVLYMSGYTENAIGHNGMLDEGINLLQKPFTLAAMKAKVREVLDTPHPQELEMARHTQLRTAREKISTPFRAERFTLQLPLRYRALGDPDWHEGTTENISRSGVLFRAEEMVQPNVQLEISLVLPAEIAGLASAEVICRGEVVRAMAPEQPWVSPALAAKILQYHFQHGSHVPEA
jgi:CheY-like chemotaxis protein